MNTDLDLTPLPRLAGHGRRPVCPMTWVRRAGPLAARPVLLLALLAPAGAAAEAPPGEPPLAAGPFVLQTLTLRSGLQFSANHGLVRHTYYERRVLHRGQPVALAGADGRPAGSFRDAWVLPDAAQPALLVGGSTGWWLVTEHAGRPQPQRLSEAGGTVAWADRPGPADPDELAAEADGPRDAAASPGRPAAAASAAPALHALQRVRRTRTTVGEPMALQGGRWLLLDGQALLDVRTLRHRALSPELPAGYRVAEDGGLLGAAPDGSAVALLHVGASRSPRDALIAVCETAGSGCALLPLHLQALTGQRGAQTPPGLLARHFSWRPRDGAAAQLVARPAAAQGPWQAVYRLGLGAPRGSAGQPVPTFTLAPVRPSALAAVQHELAGPLCLEARPAQPGDDSTRITRLQCASVPLVLRFDPAARTLAVESDAPDALLWAQAAVRAAGELLEARLQAGALREHLAPR